MPALTRDVLIIGGGIVGLTCAVELLRADSELTVTVVDRSTIGSGASHYAGAIDIPYFHSERHRELVAFSWNWYSQRPFVRDHRLPVPIHWWLEDAAEAQELQTHLLDELAPCESRGPVSGRFANAMAACGEAFVIRSQSLCRALADQIVASGRGIILESTEITDVQIENDLVAARSAAGCLYGRHSFICLGPWLPNWQSLSWFARDRRVRTKSVFGLVVDVETAEPISHSVGWISGGIFFMPYGRAGKYFMSVKHDIWDVRAEHPEALPAIVEQRTREFLAALIGNDGFQISASSVFADTYTDPPFPVIENTPGSDGRITVVTGTHGSGVRLAPALAHQATTIYFHGGRR
jgi:glycine/D-amino acid oxidase-like deaminating enzyme